MVEREEFKILVKGMKAVYAQSVFIPDQDAFNVWYELLKDLSYEALNMAIQKHIMTSSYPPTIADIREAAAQLAPDDGIMSELKAWGMVRKAICNSSYHAEEEFNRLPGAVRAAVGSPANLREWAILPTETVESVEQSHFIKSYRAAVKRDEEAAKLTPEVRKFYALERNTQPERIEDATVPLSEHITEKEGVPMPERVKQRMRGMMGKW